MPVAIAAGIGAAGAIGGGAIQASGAKNAASTQAAAAQQAANMQMQMFNQIQANLQPFTAAGTAALPRLMSLVGGVQPFQPTMQQLAQTPGYQFALGQGLQATTNQATALGQGPGMTPTGLQVSGPEGKALTGYATNLASTTYQQQFQDYWANISNMYSMLSGTAGLGANAAAMTGQAGTAAAQSAGAALQTGAAAQAAGQVGAANALGGIGTNLGNVANNYATMNLIQSMLGGQSGSLGTNALSANPGFTAAAEQQAAGGTMPGLINYSG
jgi:hypothetical protein